MSSPGRTGGLFARRVFARDRTRLGGAHESSNGDRPAPPPTTLEPPLATPSVQRAAWLCRDLLLVLGSLPGVPSGPLEMIVGRGDRPTPVRAGSFVIDDEAASGTELRLLTVGLPGLRSEDGIAASLSVAAGGRRWTLPAADLAPVVCDLRTLLREDLAPLDARTRAHVLEFLSWTPVRHQWTGDRVALSRSLLAARQALRQRLPIARSPHAEGLRVHVGVVAVVGDRRFYVRGWARIPGERLARLTVVAPEGHRVELLPGAFRHARPDVEDTPVSPPAAEDPAGFAGCFELRSPSMLPRGWVVEAQGGDGQVAESVAPEAISDPRLVLDRLLLDLGLDPAPGDAFLSEHVHPALARVQQGIRSAVRVSEIEELGDRPEDPGVSLVVPVRDHALLEVQLAHFAVDPELRDHELLFVAGPGPVAELLAEQAPWLAELYGVGFRLCLLDDDVQPSMAIDVAASIARGRRLLFMHPDVFPDRPGWLGSLTRFHERTPGAGVVTPMLLYEDDTIESAGVAFRRPARSPVWEDAPRLRGFLRDVPAAAGPTCVPAASAACFLIDRDLYEDIGGLDPAYVAGDLAVSDLCLRLAAGGFTAWCVSDSALYHTHLRGNARPPVPAAARHDAWLRTRRWDAPIAQLTEGAPSGDLGAVPEKGGADAPTAGGARRPKRVARGGP